MKKTVLRASSLAIAVMVALSLVLAGCGGNSGDGQTKPTGSTAVATGGTTAQSISTNDKQLDYAKITWYLRPTQQKDMQLVVDEVNKIFKEKINAELEIKRIDPGSYNEKLQVILAAGEEFDLCHSAPRYGYYEDVAKGAFLPLDDLLKNYAPKSFSQIPAKFWDAVKVKGKIYGLINYQIVARQTAIYVQKSMLEKYGFDLKSVKKIEDIEPLLAKMKAGEGNDKIIYDMFKDNGNWADLQHYHGLDQVGSTYSPGVVLEGDSNLTVVNQYGTDQFKAYVNLMRDFYKKGYIIKDAATNDKKREVEALGTTLCVLTDYTPGGMFEAAAQFNWNGIDAVTIDTPFSNTNSIAATMTSISRTSKNSERAMMLLELVNTDKDVFNLLVNGIENKHYKKVGENRIEPVKDSGYAPNSAWMMGNTFNSYLLPGQEDNVWDETIKLNNSSLTSTLLGFNFDPEPVKSELAQCQSAIDEFTPGLWTGTVDPEVFLPQFLDKLKKAGVDNLIANEQKQINDWKAGK